MYKIYNNLQGKKKGKKKLFNNLAPSYLQDLFHMRDVNLNNTASNLRPVAQNNYIVSQAKCNLLLICEFE